MMSLGTLAQGLQLRYHLHFSKSDRATRSHYIPFSIVMYGDTSPGSLNIMSLIWIMDIVKHELQTECHWKTHSQLFIQDRKYVGNACKGCTGRKKKRINNLNPYTKKPNKIYNYTHAVFLSAVLKDYAKYVLYLQRWLSVLIFPIRSLDSSRSSTGLWSWGIRVWMNIWTSGLWRNSSQERL